MFFFWGGRGECKTKSSLKEGGVMMLLLEGVCCFLIFFLDFKKKHPNFLDDSCHMDITR